MAIDTNLIYRAVRNVLIAANTNSSIPLSEIRTDKPSIGRYRGKTPKFDFPYAMIDIGPSRHSVGYLTNRFINDDGLVQYEVNKDYLVSVKVYSDRGESYQIANDFEFAFNFDGNLQQVHDTAEATIMSTEQVTPLPDVLSDGDQVEYNQFNVILSVRDVYVDTTTITVDKVDVVGLIHTADGSLQVPSPPYIPPDLIPDNAITFNGAFLTHKGAYLTYTTPYNTLTNNGDNLTLNGAFLTYTA